MKPYRAQIKHPSEKLPGRGTKQTETLILFPVNVYHQTIYVDVKVKSMPTVSKRPSSPYFHSKCQRYLNVYYTVGHAGTKNVDIVYCRFIFYLRKFESGVDIGVNLPPPNVFNITVMSEIIGPAVLWTDSRTWVLSRNFSELNTGLLHTLERCKYRSLVVYPPYTHSTVWVKARPLIFSMSLKLQRDKNKFLCHGWWDLTSLLWKKVLTLENYFGKPYLLSWY